MFCNLFVTTFYSLIDILYENDILKEDKISLTTIRMKEVEFMNKKIMILILALMIFIVGCGIDIKQKEKTLYESLEKEAYIIDDENMDKLIKQYNEIAKSDNEPYTLVKFIDENIKEVAENEAVAMILILEEVQKEYAKRYADELFKDNNQQELLNLSAGELLFNKAKIEEIKNADLKELVSNIFAGKYKLVNIGGAYYPVIDYEGLKAYADYLPEEIRDYFNIKAKSSSIPPVLDGEMTVTHEELGQRLVEIEKYISKYPKGIKLQDVLRCYGECLKLYLEGSVNSPIYDGETGKIKEEIMADYITLSSRKELVTSKAISKYLEIIQANENIINENVLSHVPEIYSNAIAALEDIQ